MIEFNCPHCGNDMKVAESAAGRKGNCKRCGKSVRVPDAQTSAPTPEPVVIDTKARESELASKRSKNVRMPLLVVSSSIAILILSAIGVSIFFYLTPKSKEKIIEESESSVALIKGRLQSGTGFIISDNILATNKHVISKEMIRHLKVHFPSASGESKGPFDAELIYEDDELDIALLRINTILNPLNMHEDYTFKRGQEVIVIGNPGLSGGTILENAVSSGVMSSQTTLQDKKYDQLSISINSGNSGGPVLDETGSVIGMVTLKANGSDGLGFSIPVKELVARVAKAKALSTDDIQKTRDLHNARVLSWYVTIVGEIFMGGMRRYKNAMYDSIQAGGTADDGIAAIRPKLQSEIKLDVDIVSYANKELAELASSRFLSDTAKQKLVDLWTNSLEFKSYYEIPRGSYRSYADKYDVLSDKHKSLSVSLKLLLGVKD